jgi:hypothetical protein
MRHGVVLLEVFVVVVGKLALGAFEEHGEMIDEIFKE